MTLSNNLPKFNVQNIICIKNKITRLLIYFRTYTATPHEMYCYFIVIQQANLELIYNKQHNEVLYKVYEINKLLLISLTLTG